MYNDNDPTLHVEQPVLEIYDLLMSLIRSLGSSVPHKNLDDGSGERLNGYIDELFNILSDKRLIDFKLRIIVVNGRHATHGEEYVRSLYALTSYLYQTNRGILYRRTSPPVNNLSNSGNNSPMVTNQFTAQQSTQQSTNVQIEFTQTIISLTEMLTDIERKFPDKTSKENQFAAKLKNVLPRTSDFFSIITAVLTISNELNLNVEDIMQLLGLS